MSLILSLLGSFQATVDGQLITKFRSDKVRALFAYLAIEADRPHRRATLAALFWPDHTAAAAQLNLRQTLLRLRRALASGGSSVEYLLITHTDVQFDAAGGHQVDAAWVDRLLSACEVHAHGDPLFCPDCLTRRQQAISLYRGPLLAGLTIKDSDAFDEWLVARQEQFHRQISQALESLAAYHEQNGEYELARPYTQRQLALDPWNEGAHRRLMRDYTLSGQRASALAQYESCRRILEAELGAEPDEETQALYADILAGGIPSRRPRRSDALVAVAPARWQVPVPLTSFIGRERELATLEALLLGPDARFITLLGPGGVGKSRLALRAAVRLQDQFQHGTALVPLAPLSSPDLLVAAVASALGIAFHGPQTPTQQLFTILRERTALLVMDSCEHVIPRAEFLSELLSVAPGLRVLATSQVRLNVPGEQVIMLSGFDHPDDTDKASVSDGVVLFLDRAAQALPAFCPTEAERQDIVHICRQVGGLPLSIEMAASWVRALPIKDIGRELTVGSPLAGAPQGDAGPDIALEPIFNRSWALLSPAEKYVFRRLSVFPGTFDRAAAALVAGATSANLARLLDSSFLLRPHPGRYAAHESLKRYGAGRLAEVPQEVSDTRNRYGDYYAAFLKQRLAALRGSAQRAALAELNDEIDNLREAWGWAIQEGRLESIAAAMEPLFHFYDMRSWFEEGAQAFSRATAMIERRRGAWPLGDDSGVDPRVVLGKLQAREGWLSFHLGEHRRAQALLEQSRATLYGLAAWHDLIFSLNYLAAVNFHRGEYAAARACCSESLALCEQEGERHGAAVASNILSQIAFLQGDYAAADAHGRASLAIETALGNRWSMAFSLTNLGNVAFATGAYDEALRHFEESLVIRQEMEDVRGIAICLNRLGDVASAAGDLMDAQRRYAKSLALAKDIGDRLGSAQAALRLGHLAQVIEDGAQAEQHFLEALRHARALQALPITVEVLSSLASLWHARGEATRAAALARLVWAHPVASQENRNRIAGLLDSTEIRLASADMTTPIEALVEALLAPG